MTDETKNEATPETQETPDGPPAVPMKQIIFLANGQIVWPEKTFETIDQVEDFLQRIVYRDWNNTVFGNIMADLIKQAQKRAADAKAAEAAEGQPALTDQVAAVAETKPDLQVVAKKPAKSNEELQAEINALKAQMGN